MRVLLVEDDEAVSAGLMTLLRMDGDWVERVSRGSETMAAVERFDPDVVLLDIDLRDIDGAEVYRWIHERWPTLAVVLSSAGGDAEWIAGKVARPNVTFLAKPYEFSALRKHLVTFDPATAPAVRSR